VHGQAYHAETQSEEICLTFASCHLTPSFKTKDTDEHTQTQIPNARTPITKLCTPSAHSPAGFLGSLWKKLWEPISLNYQHLQSLDTHFGFRDSSKAPPLFICDTLLLLPRFLIFLFVFSGCTSPPLHFHNIYFVTLAR